MIIQSVEIVIQSFVNFKVSNFSLREDFAPKVEERVSENGYKQHEPEHNQKRESRLVFISFLFENLCPDMSCFSDLVRLVDVVNFVSNELVV